MFVVQHIKREHHYAHTQRLVEKVLVIWQFTRMNDAFCWATWCGHLVIQEIWRVMNRQLGWHIFKFKIDNRSSTQQNATCCARIFVCKVLRIPPQDPVRTKSCRSLALPHMLDTTNPVQGFPQPRFEQPKQAPDAPALLASERSYLELIPPKPHTIFWTWGDGKRVVRRSGHTTLLNLLDRYIWHREINELLFPHTTLLDQDYHPDVLACNHACILPDQQAWLIFFSVQMFVYQTQVVLHPIHWSGASWGVP